MTAELEPAAVESGFLVGSAERSRLCQSGEYQPTETLVLWSRRAILAWAAAHPEYRDEMDVRD